jgi:hypothetical protein
MIKNSFFKISSIVLVSIIFDIGLHALTSSYSNMPETSSFSIIAVFLGTELSATLWAILSFSSSAFVFLKTTNIIYGNGLKKGIRYGSAIGLLWLLGMMEGVTIFGNPLFNEFIIGLSDAIPIFFMSLLLGILVNKHEMSKSYHLKITPKDIYRIVTIATIFLLGRYIAYFSGIIQSGYIAHPSLTLYWTFLMSTCIGMIAVLILPFHDTISIKKKAIYFGLGIFGINWAAFLVFMPILFANYFTDVLCRMSIDIFLVTVGYYWAFGMKPKSTTQ